MNPTATFGLLVLLGAIGAACDAQKSPPGLAPEASALVLQISGMQKSASGAT